MRKKLIITEKPSVARDFARVLKVSGNNNGFIENNEYVYVNVVYTCIFLSDEIAKICKGSKI